MTSIDYNDKFYNHFEKEEYRAPTCYVEEKELLLRYKVRIPHFEFGKSSLTIRYFKKGNGEFKLKNKTLKVKDDQFLVVNPNDGWEYVNEKNEYMDVLCFGNITEATDKCNFYLKTQNEGLLDNPFGEIQEDSFFFEKMLNSKHYSSGRLLKRIYELSGEKEYKFTCPDELTMEVLQSLYKEQALGYKIADRIDAKKTSTKIETFKRLITAYEFIHDNINEQISIDKLSAVSTLSKFHLFDSFKNAFGKTPHQYINRLKMAKAKEHIAKGHYPISEIADFYGFSDLSVFSKVFKKAYGRPPSYYQSNF